MESIALTLFIVAAGSALVAEEWPSIVKPGVFIVTFVAVLGAIVFLGYRKKRNEKAGRE